MTARISHPSWLRSTGLLGLLLVLLAPHWARAASASLQIDRALVGLGETATLTLTVEGGRGNEQPRLPQVPGLQIQANGRSSSTQIGVANGRRIMVMEIKYSYAITPQRIGEYTLGPAQIEVGGERLQTETVAIKVVAANDPAVARRDGLENAAFLDLVLPQRPVYVGETFVAEARLHAVGGDLRQSPQFKVDGFTLGRTNSVVQENNVRTNNLIYSRVRFLQPLTAARSGRLPVEVGQCILDIPIRRQGQFADPFDEIFGGGQRRRFNLTAPVAQLEVLPMPRDNVPAGFNGAVGDFQVSLTASPTNLQAGDPITLRIMVHGKGNFDSVQLPEQAAWKGFRVYPPNSSFDSEDPLALNGVKRFEQVVTPESASITELPPLAFSFFHPETKSYRTVSTPSIRLTVAPASSLPNLPALPAASASAAKPTNAAPELAPLKPHLGAVVPAFATPWLARPLYYALAALAPLAWLSALVWHRRSQRRSADLEAARRAQLARSIEQGLAQLATHARNQNGEAFFAALFRLLQDLVALKTGLPPAAVTEGVLETGLAGAGVPGPILERLHGLFQVCNQARYTRLGGASDLENLRAEAADLARTPELR